MPNDSGQAAAPLTIFISYASADRAQARLLGETFAQAGLDVWFDEEELAGGEAWDAKIRQQIRTCTYFVPIISATTEARREGYFRREWRLAVERTLDLADDVTFLVPIVIDETPEYKARVPEKFTTVQWLRCPGGQATPQLTALARRLAAGEARAIPPPTLTPPPRLPASETRRPSAASLYPFPTFPAFPERGHRGRFVYDLVVWAGHLIRALWVRLPRWLRFVATIVIVFKVISLGFNLVSSDDAPREKRKKSAASSQIAQSIADHATADDSDLDRGALAEKIVRAAGNAIDSFQSGRPLALVAFASTDRALQPTALQAFDATRVQLAAAGHESQIAIGAMALPPTATDEEVFARAAVLKCHWLVAAVARPAEGNLFTLDVKLYDAVAREIAWQTSRTAARDEASARALGQALATELLQHVTLDQP